MEQLTLSFKELAEIQFLNAKEKHEQESQTFQNTCTEALHDLDYCVSRGLPAYLPESTIEILSHAMMMDKFGPKTPSLSQFYRRYNVNG